MGFGRKPATPLYLQKPLALKLPLLYCTGSSTSPQEHVLIEILIHLGSGTSFWTLIPSQPHEAGARGEKPSFPQSRGWLWSHNAPAVTKSMTFTREEPGYPVKGLSLLGEQELGQPWPAHSWGCTPQGRTGDTSPELQGLHELGCTRSWKGVCCANPPKLLQDQPYLELLGSI